MLPNKLLNRAGGHRLLMKLQSAYPEDGAALLLTKQVDILDAYETKRRPLFGQVPDLARALISTDRFVPVTAGDRIADKLKRRLGDADHTTIQVVTFPRRSFFGQILWEDVAKSLPANVRLDPLIESGLSTGVIQFVLAGAGIAWLPMVIAAPYVKSGEIKLLDDVLPSEDLYAYCLRVRRSEVKGESFVWDVLTEGSQ